MRKCSTSGICGVRADGRPGRGTGRVAGRGTRPRPATGVSGVYTKRTNREPNPTDRRYRCHGVRVQVRRSKDLYSLHIFEQKCWRLADCSQYSNATWIPRDPRLNRREPRRAQRQHQHGPPVPAHVPACRAPALHTSTPMSQKYIHSTCFTSCVTSKEKPCPIATIHVALYFLSICAVQTRERRNMAGRELRRVPERRSKEWCHMDSQKCRWVHSHGRTWSLTIRAAIS